MNARPIRLAALLLALSGIHALAADADLQLHGEFIQGGLVLGHVSPGAQVLFGGRTVRVSDEGGFLIGFDRDEAAAVTLTATLPDGNVIERQLKIASRDYDIQRVDGLPQNTVTPSEQELRRIRAENARIGAARDRDDARTDFLSGWIWPARGRITGVYGSQRILNGEPRWPHYGVDVAGPVGTPVVAPADGVITLAAPDMLLSGGTIILDHGHGLSSSFLHLSKLVVSTGDAVRQGQKIGEIGATGRATGPHLDWRMNLMDRRLDPQLLVPPMSDKKEETVAASQ